MSQPPPAQIPVVGGPPPPFPGAPPAGFPNAPPVGFPAPSPFANAAPPPTQPTVVNGIPVAKQPLNTTPSKTVYVSNLNEKVKIDGKY